MPALLTGVEREACFEQIDYQVSYGKQCGYPPCCVAEFVGMTHASGSLTEAQSRVNGGTGFTPCVRHTALIIAGTICIADLIVDRDVGLAPFPDHTWIGE